MKREKILDVEKFITYLASGKELKIDRTVRKRFREYSNVAMIVSGFQTNDENTSIKPPSREGISLSPKMKAIAKRLKISEETMIDEIIKEKNNIYQLNKKKIREGKGTTYLWNLKKFSASRLENRLIRDYATTEGRRQITYKEGIKRKQISRASDLGKAIRHKGLATWGDYDSSKITFGYNKEATLKLYEDFEDFYKKKNKGEKPPSPPPIIDAIYDIYYDGKKTEIKVQISEVKTNKGEILKKSILLV